MNEELKKYYEYLKSVKADIPDTYESFAETLSDETQARTYFDYLKANKFDTPDTFENFSDTFQLKKKDISEDTGIFSETSLTEQPPLPSKEKPKERETTVIGDLLRSFKSASLRALGGIAETPMFISKTVTGLTARPLMKAMGATEEESDTVIDYLRSTSTFGQSMAVGEEAQKVLNKKAQKTEGKMTAIEGNIAQNIKEGNWGQAGELLGRGFMQSLPYLAMTAATAGGGSVAVLTTIGMTSSAQQYGELEKEKEPKRLLNSWMYGGFEAAGELVTAGLLRGVGRSFREGIVKQIEPQFIKGMAKEIAKSFGLEGSSEAATQIGQNITDIVTGVDPNRNVFDNVLDAGLIGAVAGGGIGVANIPASIIGRALASDKETTQVQDNFNQQGTLVNQIETTDSDPVKKALESRLRTLRYEADKIMDKNYELAKELSPEQHSKIAELYSVWNELQAKIDNKEIVTEQEITTTENTIEGIKTEIESIKEAKLAELGEIKEEGVKYKIGDNKFETQEEVEAWLDKNYVKYGLEPVWHQPTEKIIDLWARKNAELIEKKTLEQTKEEEIAKLKEEEKATPEEIEENKVDFIETKEGRDYYNVVLPDGQRDTFSVEEKAPQETIDKAKQETLDKYKPKIEEETKDAERIREEGGLRVRDTKKDRLETEQGEEVEFQQFIDIVNESKTPEEAFKKAQKVKGITEEESKAFREKYDPEGKLTPQQAFKAFYDEVKSEQAPVQEPEAFTEREQVEEIEQETPKEAISEEIPESEGVMPPPPEKTVETPEIAPKGKKRAGFEKRETKKGTRGSIEMRRDEIGKIVKRIIDDNPHFYAQTTRQEEIGKAKEFISSFASFDNVYSNLVKKTKNIDELTMRHVARQVMLQKLGEDLRDSMKDGSKEESDAIADKIINLDDITQKEIRISATTLAMTLWQFMTPEATVFMLNKVINEQNRTRLGFEAKQAEEFIGEWGKEAPESIKRLIKENPELRDFIEKIQAKTGRIPPTHRVTKAKAKEIANKVRSLKSSNWGLTFADPIGATAILDGALEVTARTIETTGNLLQAIQDGISEIKKSGWYKSLTNQKQKEVEGTFGKKVRENVDFDAAEYIEGQSWYREAEKPAVTEEEKVQKKEAQKTIAEADKKLREQIFDVIASHWLVEKISDKTLVDKLVEEVGLTKHEAEKIANISEEAVRRDSQKVFEATLGKKIVNTNTRKSAFEKFFNLIKRGVLTNENYYEVFADKYKLKKGLTEEEKIAIQKLAINAQQMAPYGYYGDLAFNEFLQYMAKVSEQDSWLERQGKLMVAVNYASILMGVTTHKVNLTSAGANLLIRPFLGVANPVKWADVGIKLMQGKTREAHLKNPLAALCYASQAYRIGGIIGGTTALNIIKHGNIKESSKYMEAVNNLSGQEIPELEKSTFGVGKRFRPWDKFRFKIGNKAFLGDLNPWNAFKYSGRILLAEDAAMFNEAFALELALAARREAIIGNIALSPSQLRKKILNEITGMYLTDEQVTAVEQQLEEQTQMLRMSGTEPTSLQIKQRRFELTRSLLDLKPEMEEELTQLGRGEIFTGKRGGVFSTIGDALGGLFSKHVLIKLATLPKIPFTGVLGRIADYSIDTMPGYGVIRSEGWSPTGIIARARQWNRSGQFSDFMTAPAKYGMFKSAQMGARGTPAHERQMARHYFGLVLLSGAAAVFLRDDDDIEKDKDGHPIIDITGGLHYNTWDEKEHHYLGAYTVRLGGWKFRFLNFPILNAPLAIIGNYKDAVRAGEDNDDLWARLSLLGAAWFRSLGLIKDTWLAKGINDLFELMGGLMASVGGGEERRKRVKAEEGVEIVDIDGRVQRQLENLRDDYTGLPIKYIDPLKSNLLQQVIKFTTPESRLKGTGWQLWAYNVGLQWWNDRRTDIFGQEVKTLPGDQGTAWPRKTDKRWEKMWQYNIHVRDVSARDRLTIKGVPQTLEWEQYIERKGLTQELFRDRFDRYFTETTPAVLGRKANMEITEGEYKTNRIDKDIRDIWSKTKSDVNKYMFVWDKYASKDPKLFKFLMEEGLLPDFYKPEIKDDLGYDIIFPYDKLEEFNDKIMKGFIPQVKKYLNGKSNADIEKLKSKINDKTGKSYLEDDIDHYHNEAIEFITPDIKDELMIW